MIGTALLMCQHCDAVPAAPGRKYCSDRCCKTATKHPSHPPKFCTFPGCGRPLPKGRIKFCDDNCRSKSWYWAHPAEMIARRARTRRWCVTHRNCKNRNYWLAGAPPYVGVLPGGLCWIDIAPEPQWPIALRNTRALHGVLTALFKKPHGTTKLMDEPHSDLPAWSLLPLRESPSGWAVYWSDPDALPLAGRAHTVSLFNDTRALYLSDARRIPAPKISKRGHRLVRLDAVTPVVIQSSDRTTRRQVPEASHLLSTLRLHLAPRLGLSFGEDELKAELVHRETQQEWIDCGGKYGRVPGFIGHLILDVNASVHWLLACAETLGVGGRVSMGFGNVHVSEVGR